MPDTAQEPTPAAQEVALVVQELTLTEELLLWGAVVICLAIVGGIQYRAFGTAGKTRVPGSLASFFYLHEIVEKWQRNVCAVATAIPLSFVFFVIAIKPETFGLALIKALLQLATEGTDVSELLDDVLVYAPPALFPFVILLISFLVFGAQIRFLFRNIEKGVVSVAGLAHRAEDLARTIANELLSKQAYEDIVNTVEERQKKKLVLAEELENSSNEQRLSFQLLHLARQDIPFKGLRDALLEVVDQYLYDVMDKTTLEKLREPGELEAISFAKPILRLRWFHGLATVVIFAIACGVYAGLVPMAHAEFRDLGVVWPQYEKMSALLGTMLLMVLASVIPLFIGLLFLAKRTENVQETIVQRLSVVFAAVSLLSIVVNFAYVLLQRAEFKLGQLVGNENLIGDFQEFAGSSEVVYAFSHSLIPGFAILGMVFASRWVRSPPQDSAIAVGTAIITFGHMLCYAVFEEVSGVAWRYYWHQGLSAFFLTAVAFAIGKLFWTPLWDVTGQRLAETAGQSLGARER